MAAAAILKDRKIAIFQQRLDRSRRNLARWHISTCWLSDSQNFKNLKIQDGGARHLEKSKNRKIAISQEPFDLWPRNLARWRMSTLLTVQTA